VQLDGEEAVWEDGEEAGSPTPHGEEASLPCISDRAKTNRRRAPILWNMRSDGGGLATAVGSSNGRCWERGIAMEARCATRCGRAKGKLGEDFVNGSYARETLPALGCPSLQ